ncbi:DUF6011 domain-containing protein [Mycobacterium attenuatum]|uniref:DUF6011 domain-containing protein n=1 Tax=Mycobacterium attenuatum TaxID=2341086 RepID=UPI000F02307B|nr:hypothetical protein LAUMK41_04604 [Mycobacterium attenuatum]
MQERRSPGSEAGAPSTTPIATSEFSPLWRQDWYDPLSAEDRADLAVLIAAAERGYRLATRCLRCGQWLVAPSSVRRHMGPVCAAKVAADGAVA